MCPAASIPRPLRAAGALTITRKDDGPWLRPPRPRRLPSTTGSAATTRSPRPPTTSSPGCRPIRCSRDYWKGASNDNQRHARQLIVDFMVEAAGGPAYYTGRDMKRSHDGMHIDAADWDAFMRHSAATLDHFGVATGSARRCSPFSPASRTRSSNADRKGVTGFERPAIGCGSPAPTRHAECTVQRGLSYFRHRGAGAARRSISGLSQISRLKTGWWCLRAGMPFQVAQSTQ